MISYFRGKYDFLSNFYNAPISYGGNTYRNNEAAFQAAKCPERASEFRNLDASAAKKLGRQVILRTNWEDIKERIMFETVLNKFTQNEDLKAKLLATGDEELVEGKYMGRPRLGCLQWSRGESPG